MAEHQKSRAGQTVSDETVAKFAMAKAFLIGEWLAALLMVASFTMLYVVGIGPRAWPTPVAYAVSVTAMLLGTFAYVRARRYYLATDFPWKIRWHHAALVIAGSAVVFWLLFVVILALTAVGVYVV